MSPTPVIIFDFTTESDLSDWRIMDDVVMGGRSDSNLQINEAGHGWFHGFVSLENNGGFASTRYNLKETLQVKGHTTCKIRLKADGKTYQFRTKESQYDRYSYIYTFETTGEWETVEIPLSEMYASFRGRRLDPTPQLTSVRLIFDKRIYSTKGLAKADMEQVFQTKREQLFNALTDDIKIELGIDVSSNTPYTDFTDAKISTLLEKIVDVELP